MLSRSNLPSPGEIREILSFLPVDDRGMWIKTARVLGRCYPGNAEIFGIFREWASRFQNRRPDDLQHERREFDSAPSDGTDYGIGVLISDARQRGWQPKRKSELEGRTMPVEIVKPALPAQGAEPSWEAGLFAQVSATASAITKFLFLCPDAGQRVTMLSEISDDGFRFFPPPYSYGLRLLMQYCKTHEEYTWPAFGQWARLPQRKKFIMSQTDLDAMVSSPDRPQTLDNCRDFWKNLQVDALALLSVQSAQSFVMNVRERPYAAAVELTTLMQSLSPRSSGRLYAGLDFDELIASDIREARDPDLRFKAFVPTYIGPLDDCIQGWRRGEVSILAAHSGVGKTWFGIDAALRLLQHGHRVLFISAEMDARAIARRMFTASEGVSSQFYQDPSRPISVYLDNFRRRCTGHLSLYEGRGVSIEDIENQISRCELTGGLDLAIVDYLQLIENRRGGDQVWERVYNSMRRLTQIAQRYNVPILTLAQLNNPNRNPQSGRRGDKKSRSPGLYDLADSTAVVRDAATVLALYHENRDVRANLTLKILKSRYGGRVEDIRMTMTTGGALRELPPGQGFDGPASVVGYGAAAHMEVQA